LQKHTNESVISTKTSSHPHNNRRYNAQLLETPVAVCINGISQAVMMISPQNLEDFALGFALSEGLIQSPKEVLDIVIDRHDEGWQIDLTVLARTHHQLQSRRRNMAGPSGCGLCGIDSICMAMCLPTEINQYSGNDLPSETIIMQARDALLDLQKQHNGSKGNHCAGYFDLSANSIAYREDVGRHSALDKLLGTLTKNNLVTTKGFALLSSRCSHDLIVKSARLSLRTLVTLAQPTDLAVSSARKTGLTLFCFQHGQLKRFA